MRSPLRLLLLPLALAAAIPARAASLPSADSEETVRLFAGVAAADDERLAALKATDRLRLEAIFSDDLRYGHSSGKVDTKASYIESLTHSGTIYESFDYLDRSFVQAGPGVVLMTGRVLIRGHNPSSGRIENDLHFLAVWRAEGDRWRFLSWQACKHPAGNK